MSDTAAPASPRFSGVPMLGLWGRLVWRFGPQLIALSLLGQIARDLFLEASVQIGYLNHLAGLTALTLVVLAKLVVTVAMFETVRPGLPALDAAARSGASTASEENRGARHAATALTLTLVPFFAYYAAWGFLGDAVREYSKLALAIAPFGGGGFLLDVSGGWWLAASVGASWLVRRVAKLMKARGRGPVWDIVIVVCEANWAFIGLYVISGWKDEILAFVAALPEWIATLIGLGTAKAAGAIPPPVEQQSLGLWPDMRGLFFYALFPVVWLTLAALVYGYDVHGAEEPQGRLARLTARWRSAPKQVRDFVDHFVAGTLKRYQALANGVRLTLAAGVALVALMVVCFRALDWLAAWGWLGLAYLIGPHELDEWQAIAGALTVLLGAPSQPGDGALVEPLKICLLAATLETAFAAGGRFRRLG